MKETLTPEQAQSLTDQYPDPVMLFDENDRVVATNAAFNTLVGGQGDALVGRSAVELANNPLAILLTAEDTFAFLGADDQHCYLTARDLLLAPGGQAIRARVLRDVSEVEHLRAECEHLQSELEAQALHDRITGLLNRRGLMVALEPQVSRSRRYNNPMALVMMDVYGGDAEEAFLVKVSQILKDQLRWADVIACSEEHEFIIALPETHRADALKLTEKLNERLAQEFDGRGPAWAAYGVVEWQKTDNANTLLRRAQTALDQARAARDGRSAVAL